MFRRFLRPPPQLREKFVVNFKDPALGIKTLLTRCDQDLGGFSTVNLDVITPPSAGSEESPFARFHGDLSLDLPEDRPDVVRLGYSMFRTQDVQPSFLGLGGSEFHDWSTFNQLALRVRGDHRKYFVNIQADTPYPTDLYQHRLFLKTPGEWETVTVPFANFILTNGGVIQQQQPLDTEHVRSVGIGLVDGLYGPYSLDIEWIKVLNGDALQNDNGTHPPGIDSGDGKPELNSGSPEPSQTASKAVPGKRLSVDD